MTGHMNQDDLHRAVNMSDMTQEDKDKWNKYVDGIYNAGKPASRSKK